ncbi:MAG: hypothetical protein ACE37F_37730 [Nannocystaceae bacterium]|nr:hypothetical protein [bacterium]
MSEVDLRELVAALKHDLAKYVAWRSANYPEDAWRGPLQDDFAASLQADVLRTKGDLSAWQVWDEAAAQLGEPLPHAELEEVAAAVDVLRGHEEALRAGNRALADARGSIRQAQSTIRSQLRDLHRRLAR